ncbi:MAG: response regulator [Candidatus Doudnabacteria bacterium]
MALKEKKSVLIVEDDLLLADVMANRFRLEGFDVAVAADGKDALRRIAEEHYDVMLLDLMMPLFNGLEVLDDLKKRKITTPVFVMSSLTGLKEINRAKELGAVDYFVKTAVTPDLVVKQIEKLFV